MLNPPEATLQDRRNSLREDLKGVLHSLDEILECLKDEEGELYSSYEVKSIEEAYSSIDHIESELGGES